MSVLSVVGMLPFRHTTQLKTLAYTYWLSQIQLLGGVGDQKIWAGQATAAEAKLLRIEPGDTILGMERITYTRSDRPLEYVKAIYRPEHYTFSMRLKR